MKLQQLNEALNVLFVRITFSPYQDEPGVPGGQIVGPFANKAERDKFIDRVSTLNDRLGNDYDGFYPIEHIDPYNPVKEFMSPKEFIKDFLDGYGDDFSD